MTHAEARILVAEIEKNTQDKPFQERDARLVRDIRQRIASGYKIMTSESTSLQDLYRRTSGAGQYERRQKLGDTIAKIKKGI
jgi:hypothetical protein